MVFLLRSLLCAPRGTRAFGIRGFSEDRFPFALGPDSRAKEKISDRRDQHVYAVLPNIHIILLVAIMGRNGDFRDPKLLGDEEDDDLCIEVIIGGQPLEGH